MKTQQTNRQYRGWVLSALLFLGTLALIALPTEGQPMGKWFAMLLTSKALCFALFALSYKLYKRWTTAGGFGAFLDRLLKDGEEE